MADWRAMMHCGLAVLVTLGVVTVAGAQEPVSETIALSGGASIGMVSIPAGSFTMGSPESERGRGPDESPQHSVTISRAFQIGKTEVTQAQWRAVMGTAAPTSCGSYGVGDAYPVYCVSWYDIAGPGGFIEKLNQQQGTTKYRLPSEAEWEYAARGGTTAAFSFTTPSEWSTRCDGWADAKTHMWWCGNAGTTAHQVGEKAANPRGLQDIHGNIAEWVQDEYHSSYQGAPTDGSAWESASATSRVYRGGYWADFAYYCRSAERGGRSPESSSYGIGFRVAASLEEDVRPTVASISPNVAPNKVADPDYFADTLEVRVQGTGFVRHDATSLELIDPFGGASPTAEITSFEGCDSEGVCTIIVATLGGFVDLPEGPRDVVVTNHGGASGIAENLFYVSSLHILSLEVVQGVPAAEGQGSAPDNLVAEHDTVIRVSLVCRDTGCSADSHKAAATGRLHVLDYRGRPMPGSPFRPGPLGPRGGTTVAILEPSGTYPIQAQRQGRDALNFVFRATDAMWDSIASSSATFAFEIDPRAPDVAPSGTAGPDRTVNLVRGTSELEFGRTPAAGAMNVAVLVEGNDPVLLPMVTGPLDYLAAAYPISASRLTSSMVPTSIVFTNESETNARLSEWFVRQKASGGKYTHAVLVAQYLTRGDTGFSTCYGWCQGAVCTSLNPRKIYCGEPVVLARLDPWSNVVVSGMRKSLAHELGHTFLLGDTYEGGADSFVVNPVTPLCEQYFGCPVELGAVHTLMGLVSTIDPSDPNDKPRLIDFMSNSGPDAWVDRRTWDYLGSKLGLSMPLQAEARVSEAAGEWLVLQLDAARGGGVQISSAARMTGPLSTRTPPGDDHALRLLAADGSELAAHKFTTEIVPENHVEQPESLHVSLTVPFVPGTRKIQISHGGVVVTERGVSANPPVVTVTAPNGGLTLGSSLTVAWTASDPDGDALTYSVLVSGDGTAFVPVALGLGVTTYVLDTALLAGTTTGRVRVVANDGVNEGSDTSDGAFTLGRRPPVARISAPANGAVLPSDGACLLSGGAHDPEDGFLDGASLVFASSRDGSLGAGRQLYRALSQGTHVITLTATDSDGQTGSASATVTVSANVAPLAATLSAAPSSGLAPLNTRLTATASGGVSPYAFDWRFGDARTSVGGATQDHTFESPGSYDVLVAVSDSQGASVQAETTVVVGAPQEAERYLVPAAAHSPGSQGTQWRTDLVLHNPGDTAEVASVFLLERDTDNSGAPMRSYSVAASTSLLLDDVVLRSFGESNLGGGLGIGATGRLVVSSRTYNNAATGTYGQYVPGNPEADAIGAGEEVRLIQLTRNSSYRTNVGLASFAETDTTVKVTVHKADGTNIGERSYTLEPQGVVQTTDLIGALGATSVADAYAKVRSDSSSAGYLAYASVIDNRTGDPIQVAPAVSSSGTPLYLPAAARAQGYGGSLWRTDLEVHNPGAGEARYLIELLRRGVANTSPTSRSFTLASGRSVRHEDVLGSVFGFDGAATLRITPTQGTVAATQRTYNDQAAGTFGQFIAALPEAGAITHGQTARLVQLAQSESDTSGFRTNLGIVNATGSTITVVAALLRGNGTPLGSRTYTVPAYGYLQEDKVFRYLTSSAVEDGFAELQTTTGGGRFFAYASVIDNRSGDPITVPADVLGEAACSYVISPASRSHGAGAESGTIQVSTSAGCAWTATAGVAWVHVTAGASGSGSGTVTYQIDANPGGTARSGTIAVAGKSFGVTQAGAANPNEITVTLPGSVPLTMVKIAAGTFQMGSPSTERGRSSVEQIHQVTLSKDYYIGKYEVTQKQWMTLVGSLPASDDGVGDSVPVYGVTWNQIAGPGGFVEKLNAHLTATGQVGAGLYRLPTEAEWEHAARAGTTTPFSFGDDLSCSVISCGSCALFDLHLWWCGSQVLDTQPVGQKRPNAWGLHDMHGNVDEWVADWYGSYPSTAVTDPTGPSSGITRVIRGGTWAFPAAYSRSAYRWSMAPVDAPGLAGFRLARSK